MWLESLVINPFIPLLSWFLTLVFVGLTFMAWRSRVFLRWIGFGCLLGVPAVGVLALPHTRWELQLVDLVDVLYLSFFSCPLLALCAIVFWRSRRYGPLRRKRGAICTMCGYKLRGLPQRRCPECGQRF